MSLLKSNLFLIISIVVVCIAIYLNYLLYIKDSRKNRIKSNKKAKQKILNEMVRKIDENTELSDYGMLYNDYNKLTSEIEKYMDSNKYVKNEKKLLEGLEELKEAQAEYERIKKDFENKDYKEKFSDEDVNNIKDLIKILKIEH